MLLNLTINEKSFGPENLYAGLSLSVNKFGDSGYLLVSGLAGVIILALSLYVYSRQKDEGGQKG